MSRSINCGIAGAIYALLMVWTTSALAIETTYGEDPVPNSKCTDDFIDLGYGIDPIPAKSPYVRWQEWRASRGLAPTVGIFKRQQGESRFKVPPAESEIIPPAERNVESWSTAAPPHPEAQGTRLPASKRNARTRNLPPGSSVR